MRASRLREKTTDGRAASAPAKIAQRRYNYYCDIRWRCGHSADIAALNALQHNVGVHILYYHTTLSMYTHSLLRNCEDHIITSL